MSISALERAKAAKEDARRESAQDAEIRRLSELVSGGSTSPETAKKKNTAIAVAVIALVVIVIVVVAKKKRK